MRIHPRAVAAASGGEILSPEACTSVSLGVATPMPQTDEETLQLWREQCRRQMKRPLSARLKYGFVRVANREHTNRSFGTMDEYRAWCATQPSYLGYGRANQTAKV